MDDLAAYLAAAGRTPFAYGRWDCALFVAGWIEARTGVDVGDPFRGRYRTELGCARVVRRAGGLDAIFRTAAEASGARVIESYPQPGDWGLIPAVTPQGDGLVGAIRGCGGRWVVLGERGLLAGPGSGARVWRV